MKVNIVLHQDGCSFIRKFDVQTIHLVEVDTNAVKLWVDCEQPITLTELDEVKIEVNNYDNNIKNINNTSWRINTDRF